MDSWKLLGPAARSYKLSNTLHMRSRWRDSLAGPSVVTHARAALSVTRQRTLDKCPAQVTSSTGAFLGVKSARSLSRFRLRGWLASSDWPLASSSAAGASLDCAAT